MPEQRITLRAWRAMTAHSNWSATSAPLKAAEEADGKAHETTTKPRQLDGLVC